MINRILPLLNKAIPAALAVKGLGKIDPRLEKFFSASVASGYSIDTALDFIRRKFENPAQQNERQRLDQGAQNQTLRPDEAASRQTMIESERVPNALQSAASIGGGIGAGLASLGNTSNAELPQKSASIPPMQNGGSSAEPSTPAASFIAQHPELGNYLDQQINAGKTPEQAATMAKQHKKFAPAVSDIEQNVGMDFVSLVNQLFSTQTKRPQGNQPTNSSLSGLLQTLKQFDAQLKARKGG